MVVTITEAVRNAGEIPEGTLYAVLCDRVDLTTFNRLLAAIIRGRLVSRQGHMLRWTGPKIPLKGGL
jgi:hypothetical protein